jgi:glycosyltransferase involved in cell wall biosynthesis
MKISLSQIVKNESSCLEQCLTSVVGIDEIVICDTGSEDNTIDIAKKFTDKVFTDYKWNDDFAEARNHCLKKCTGDWILIIDADEYLESSLEDIYKVIEYAEEKGIKAINCKVSSVGHNQIHNAPRLFKNCPEIFWKGAIHNHLNILGGINSDIVIKYGYSEAHKKDPDRTLRILTKEVEKNPNCSREKYYLAREYFYRSNWIKALEIYDDYLKTASFMAERADAYLSAARCLWNLKRGEEARQYCFNAININANFKEAILFMAEISWEKNAKTWRKMAEHATNEDVLFIR